MSIQHTVSQGGGDLIPSATILKLGQFCIPVSFGRDGKAGGHFCDRGK